MNKTQDAFPYLIVRIMASVYKNVQLNITVTDQIQTYHRELKGIHALKISLPRTFSKEQRKAAICESAQYFAENIKFRVALVWSKDETIYFSPHGIEDVLDTPPSGGFNFFENK